MYHPYYYSNITMQPSLDHYRQDQPEDQLESIANKRKQHLERNRLAAYRCREKKKNEQQHMVEQAEYLETRNASLQVMVNALKNQVMTLRELLLAHDVCDCEKVHSFIQKSCLL
ncbi:uncharacterized protein B0P05DRAFT_550226 [Gilbertella persicaria]|uniref:BZIP domain-containing protein n=1 Tax=Rhizopus stolonifer TaxID=4846 RepID=A0A367KKD6_RHIST|nr:uncharacterized protein B0P05DRAFT_550226 [Gilbertella persicaria]KAI8070571.1 hypothetical protein B0P05DRAFT_550226 [Gilbertella persicaria]RCI02694.1 hypothetical protein CU098_011850 [Rhizopus stolonifer]